MQPPDQITADLFSKNVLETVTGHWLVISNRGQRCDVELAHVQVLPANIRCGPDRRGIGGPGAQRPGVSNPGDFIGAFRQISCKILDQQINRGRLNTRLPVVLPPVSGELFSSWIARHAAFYGVPSLTMLHHCLPEAVSLRGTDRSLSRDQAIRLAKMFSMDAKTVRRMTFANVQSAAHRFIAMEPIQRCHSCVHESSETEPILRSELQGWRITCPHCGRPFRGLAQCDRGRPLNKYRAAALRGEKLLDDDAERDIQTWTSPLEVARLLLMRRVPWPFPRDAELWRYRVLGALIPDLDDVIARERSFPPSPKHPILPLRIRPALLAGVAIVERAGPEMLKMLQAHTCGHNRNRFIEATDHLIYPAFGLPSPRQMQLI